MKKFFAVFFAIVMSAFLTMCSGDKDQITVSNQSYYMDFKVVEDQVYIDCYVVLLNTYDVEKKVTLTAISAKDAEVGLLKDELIKAVDENGEEIVFTLAPNAMGKFEVRFVGEYGGVKRKYSKFLPEVVIKEIS